MTALRDYQTKAIESLRNIVRSGKRRVCLVMPTGTGKSLTGATIVAGHLAAKPSNKVVVYVHRHELAVQFANNALGRLGIPAKIASAGEVHGPRDARVTVAMVQTVDARPELAPDATLALWDECFPAGTMVSTPSGSKPIELVKAGDVVLASDGATIVARPVLASMVRTTTNLTALTTSSRKVTCTPNHPIFDGKVYRRADSFKEGDSLATLNVCCVRSRIRRNKIAKLFVQGGTPNVFTRVRHQQNPKRPFGKDGENKQSPRVGSNGCAQSNAQRIISGEDESVSRIHRTHAEGTRRQRKANARTAKGCSRNPWRRMGVGALDLNGSLRKRMAFALHNRRGQSSTHACCGGRRRKPLRFGKEGKRHSKGCFLALERVASVESQELNNEGCAVYNLSVDGVHSYFANGVLVHNCHHLAATTWKAISGRYEKAITIGLTATPVRADGKPLGDVFDHLHVVLSTADAVEQGYLVPCRVYAPESYGPRLSAEPTDVYRDHGKGRKTLVFATNCPQSRRIAEEITALGYRAAHVDGNTPKAERDRIIRAFGSGEIRVLSSVGILTEGFDDPSAEVAIVARGADHAGTWLQIVGRVLRLSPGKTMADVWDLRGIVHKHGMPTDEREFSLDGDPIRCKDSDRLALVRCKACGAVSRASVLKCPVCGQARPPPKDPKVERRIIQAYVARETDDQRRAYRDQLESIAKARGYHRGWVDHRMRAKYGQ